MLVGSGFAGKLAQETEYSEEIIWGNERSVVTEKKVTSEPKAEKQVQELP